MATIGDRKFQNYGDQSWDSLTDEDLDLIRSGAFDDENNLINAVEGQRHSKDADLLNSIGGGNGKGYDILGADYDEADRAYALKNLIEFLPWGVAGGVLKGGQLAGKGLQGLKTLRGMRNLEKANALEKQAAGLRGSVDEAAGLIRGNLTGAERRALERADKIEGKVGKLRGKDSSQQVMNENQAKAEQLWAELNNPNSRYYWENMDASRRAMPVNTMNRYEQYLTPEARRYGQILNEADSTLAGSIGKKAPAAMSLGERGAQGQIRTLEDFARSQGLKDIAGKKAATDAADNAAQAAENVAKATTVMTNSGKKFPNEVWNKLSKEQQKAWNKAKKQGTWDDASALQWLEKNNPEAANAFKALQGTTATEAAAATEAATATEAAAAAAPEAAAATEATEATAKAAEETAKKGGLGGIIGRHPKAAALAGAGLIGYPVVSGYLADKNEEAVSPSSASGGKKTLDDIIAEAGEEGYVQADGQGRIVFYRNSDGRGRYLIDNMGNPVTVDNYADYYDLQE